MTSIIPVQWRSICLQMVGIVLIGAIIPARQAVAESDKFDLLYSFHSATGSYPLAAPIVDSDGNLYGTTQNGGARGLGSVFEITKEGKEIVLHSFKEKPDGNSPLSSLVRDAEGNLYGTTTQGGAYGFGTIFEVDSAGKESVLYSFKGTDNDGRYPSAGLVRDDDGTLYGTTQDGGEDGFGTVFKLDAAGAEMVLHSFKGYPGDGEYPIATLIRDGSGNIYGTTEIGGHFNNGTIFELSVTGKESVIFNFPGNNGGGYLFGGVIRDDQGNFYGTTAYGGNGVGTVFKVSAKGKETVLHTFSGNDGAYPSAGVIRDAKGNLYGTAEFGGTAGLGIVFEITAGGSEIQLHGFDGSDGADLLTGLAFDGSGNLFGTATEGGAFNQGTVFKITP